MVRPLSLLTALALAAPLPALAQSYPASSAVALGVHSLPVQPRTLALNETAAATFTRPGAAEAAQPAATPPQPLKPQTRRILDTDEVPTVEVHAKDAWFDDQGFRATPTRVSFKQRF